MNLVVSIFIALVCTLTNAMGASKDRGGADAVLCYKSEAIKIQVSQSIKAHSNNKTKVNLRLESLSKKAKLLDLWEAEKPSGFPGQAKDFTPNKLSVEKIYEMVITQLRNANFYGEMFDEFLTSPSDWTLQKYGVLEINDAGYIGKVPNNCLIVQVAYYDGDSGLVHYDGRITEQFDQVENKALRIHEDLYRYYRYFVHNYNIKCLGYQRSPRHTTNCKVREINSSRTRKVVSYLISSDLNEETVVDNFLKLIRWTKN